MTDRIDETHTHSAVKVSYLLRFILTCCYIVVSVFIVIGIGFLVTSKGCPMGNRCTEPDQIIFAVVALIDFIIAFVMMFLGMMGRLPGIK